MRSFDKIQGGKRLSPPQPTGNRFSKSASKLFANYPPSTPKRYLDAISSQGFSSFVRSQTNCHSADCHPTDCHSEGSRILCQVQDPTQSTDLNVCAPRAYTRQPAAPLPHLSFCDWYSADWLPLPASPSPSMLSIRMCFWRQLFAHRGWKRNFYRLGSARSIYFRTNWYQLRRNLRRQGFHGKVISCQRS